MELSTAQKKQLFWDIDLDSLDYNKHAEYIIARTLEKGTLLDLKTIFKIYTRQQVIEVVINSLQITARTAYFWKEVFNITEPIRCLEKSYQITRKKHWQH